MSNSPKILITGASGFIGSFLVEEALRRGYDTWAGIRKSSNLDYLQDQRIKFIDFNFNSKEKLEKQLSEFYQKNGKFDYIIHNAGVTKCLNKDDFDRVNYQNTVNFIDALISTQNTPCKFIFMSSLSVMGKGDETGQKPFFTEDTPKPNTAYGRSKVKAENYIRSTETLPHLIFRPTGVYGPREKDYFMMLKTVKSGLNIGAGFKPQHLTFIYVKDLAQAIFNGIESDIINKTYFVADGNTYTDKEYTELIKETLDKKRTLNFKIPFFLLRGISIISESISFFTKKASTLNRDKYIIMSQRNWKCDITPLINDLNFKAKYNLKDGLKESIDWYKQHKWL
ncbi:NAD-dependent epimerase/dehydratase family protein [Dysgonomonas massiliensis]|uniref:NAD-dependent epimerase/dehydratase family protein n=1 Tax=Dysgonomonas massiliensis TaxID=2040292 RepID=UPI000C764081|nr:NAD(P)-dependent oxidoreductase [Dysgonomonas massiliensis]